MLTLNISVSCSCSSFLSCLFSSISTSHFCLRAHTSPLPRQHTRRISSFSNSSRSEVLNLLSHRVLSIKRTLDAYGHRGLLELLCS